MPLRRCSIVTPEGKIAVDAPPMTRLCNLYWGFEYLVLDGPRGYWAAFVCIGARESKLQPTVHLV